MRFRIRRIARLAAAVVIAVLMLLMGVVIVRGGCVPLRRWPSVSIAFAAWGGLWLIAGAALVIGGLWALGSLGGNRIPLRIGGAGAILSGGSLIVGVLTYVVPCSGPD
jgi:hypothetical protein